MYRIEEYELELRASKIGRQIISIIKQHADEVGGLINNNRQVMVTWQRNKGAFFLSEFIGSAFNDKGMKKEMDGLSLSSLIRRMAVALQDHGSKELNKIIDQYLMLMLDFAETPGSLNDIFKKIRQYE